MKFTAQGGGPDRPQATGKPSRLNDKHRAALAARLIRGKRKESPPHPSPHVHFSPLPPSLPPSYLSLRSPILINSPAPTLARPFPFFQSSPSLYSPHSSLLSSPTLLYAVMGSCDGGIAAIFANDFRRSFASSSPSKTLSLRTRAWVCKALGRPLHHAQATGAIERFKKAFRAPEKRLGRGEEEVETSAIDGWFADEARVGQTTKITRRWAKSGARPRAPKDQRTASAYLRADGPKDGKGGRPWSATLQTRRR